MTRTFRNFRIVAGATIKPFLIVGAAIFILAGCAAKPIQPPAVIVQPCGADIPERPIMPTEGLPPDVALDDFVKAAIAEIERREGYETMLRGALIYCKTGEVFK